MPAWTYRLFVGKAAPKIVPLRSRIPCWKGLSADSEEKREPVSDINAGVVDSLKVLDSEQPIREAGISLQPSAASLLGPLCAPSLPFEANAVRIFAKRA
jgi:hypothetical protein